jgi:predicted nucleic acid-binding protein
LTRPEAAWLDANVLLRVLTDEPKALANRAQALMKRAERGDVVLVLPVVVLAEVVWVLGSYYGYDRARIATGLQPVITARGIAAEASNDVLEALTLMADHNVDFPDAYVAALAARRHERVATFDSDFRKLPVQLFPV